MLGNRGYIKILLMLPLFLLIIFSFVFFVFIYIYKIPVKDVPRVVGFLLKRSTFVNLGSLPTPIITNVSDYIDYEGERFVMSERVISRYTEAGSNELIVPNYTSSYRQQYADDKHLIYTKEDPVSNETKPKILYTFSLATGQTTEIELPVESYRYLDFDRIHDNHILLSVGTQNNRDSYYILNVDTNQFIPLTMLTNSCEGNKCLSAQIVANLDENTYFIEHTSYSGVVMQTTYYKYDALTNELSSFATYPRDSTWSTRLGNKNPIGVWEGWLYLGEFYDTADKTYSDLGHPVYYRRLFALSLKDGSTKLLYDFSNEPTAPRLLILLKGDLYLQALQSEEHTKKFNLETMKFESLGASFAFPTSSDYNPTESLIKVAFKDLPMEVISVKSGSSIQTGFGTNLHGTMERRLIFTGANDVSVYSLTDTKLLQILERSFNSAAGYKELTQCLKNVETDYYDLLKVGHKYMMTIKLTPTSATYPVECDKLFTQQLAPKYVGAAPIKGIELPVYFELK